MNGILLLRSDRPRVELPGDNRLLSEFAFELGKVLSSADIFSRSGSVFKGGGSSSGRSH